MVVLAVLLVASVALFVCAPSMDQFEAVLRDAGPLAPLLFITAIAVGVVVVPIPTSPLSILGTFVFGPVRGSLFTLVGATIGAVIAFYISRFLLRDAITRRLEHNALYETFRGKRGGPLAWAVFLTRLMPQVSFDIISYAAGLTDLPLWLFVLATFTGMIPFVVLVAVFGAIIKPYVYAFVGVMFALFALYIAFALVRHKRA
jgi:uncharacterized membrane protein YdjX (TVP38/TMEM64 family)